MTSLRFTKMQGAGNDFVVIDGITQAVHMTPTLAKRLANRHFGVGADQLLLVERPTDARADFGYRIFNNDGGEVEHCGNGARCFVRFVHEKGLSKKNPLIVQIATGLITLSEQDDGLVTAVIGNTSFDPASVAFDIGALPMRAQGQVQLWQLPVQHGSQTAVEVGIVGLSNPHAVTIVDDVDTAPVATLGPLIEGHSRFANRINAGFMQIIDRHHVKLRVYERGAGETLACGTGACAAVASGIARGLLDSPVTVQARGGVLRVDWDGTRVQLTGDAVTVFEGTIEI